MRISTSTATLHPSVLTGVPFRFEEIPGLIKSAGFSGVDWSLWQFCLHNNERFGGFMSMPDWEVKIHSLRETDEAAGIQCGQTHCVSVGSSTYKALCHDQLHLLEQRCLIASGILGARWMVIHPFAPEGSDPEASARFFIEYLKPLQEHAHRCQVGIAIENMILHHGTQWRFCATAEELMALVDTIDDPFVGCCWDTGHGYLSGQNQFDAITLLGNRIKALHIDDNYGQDMDLHLLPYEGGINWNDVLRALALIDYQNDFAFEHALHPMPADVMPEQLRFMYRLGESMLSALGSDREEPHR